MSQLKSAAGVICALLLWQGAVVLTGVPQFILPSPWRVAQAIVREHALLAEHTLVTLSEVLLGLILGTALGAATAICLALWPLARRAAMPLLLFSQAVPVFAIAPILTLWFGYGLASKVVMTLLIIYFPVTSALHDGLTRIDPGLRDLARTMGATRWYVMRRIRIPHALPSLATGLRLAAVYAPIGAVIGEWVGASRGLGYLMLLANGRAKTDLMFAGLIALALLTLGLHAMIGRIADRLEAHAAGR